jgi:hypothetical protein
MLRDAGFRDTLGATITADGHLRRAVFVARSGSRAVVVANGEYTKRITARVDLPTPRSLVVATPENPECLATSGKGSIPARSTAVIMEVWRGGNRLSGEGVAKMSNHFGSRRESNGEALNFVYLLF